MIEKLITVFKEEKAAFENLLRLLEEQYKYLTKGDVFQLEVVLKNIESANKSVASLEIERRRITGEGSVNEIIKNYHDEELRNLYRDIKLLLNELKTQKESNDMLIKQGIGFTTQILDFLNPKGNMPKTYNSYGKVKR